ncbi:hypothetical protein [Sphingorhabdus sp. Alg231-15]|uniref:hypothetical protein n=1 Tax=Sphingorhabdus sp. Alg231-15 TaxID=1922222 RepID=UPI00307C0DA4
MLTIAIATFFALAFVGSVLTIAMMFHAYQHKIKAVILADLGEAGSVTPAVSQRSFSSVSKTYRPSPRRHSFQPAPLRAAA